ncbi:MAG TPA: hypothetical protein PLU88_00110 [Armatimonadota bacterium]|mgnify:CR=1 FL=1|nr:hypothetical protein [Armatimonadota bacterium]
MGVRCYLVKKWLETAPPDQQDYPVTVTRHLADCEHCRAEAASYQRLQAVLRENLEVSEKCQVSWDQVCARMTAIPAKPAGIRLKLVPVAAAAVCLLIFCLIGSIILNSNNAQSTNDQIVKHQTDVEVRPSLQPETGLIDKVEATANAKQEENNDLIQTNSIDKQPKNLTVLNVVKPVNNNRKPNRTDKTIIVNNAADPGSGQPPIKNDEIASINVIPPQPDPDLQPVSTDDQKVAIVTPTEHAIGVVGVDMDVQNDHNTYAIHRVNGTTCAYLDL